MYKIITQIMGGKPVAVPLKNYTYDLIAMREAVTKKTKIVFIANPNNPTGTIVRNKEVRQFIRNMPKNIIIVFDEAYAEYVESKDYPRSLEIVQENRNCIMLRTFSKICSLAGLRIGYGIANPQLISCLNRVRLPFNTSNIAQVAALASLRETKWMARIRRINREGKKFLYSEFGKMGLEYVPSEANFILVKIGRDAPGVAQGLLKKGIIVRAMTSFGLPEYVRVTIGRPAENKKFIQALKSVKIGTDTM